jgi:hypothetical protein
MEERLESMSGRIEAARDCGEYEDPDVTVEQVAAMLHAHLEGNRIRREEYEKQSAASRRAASFRLADSRLDSFRFQSHGCGDPAWSTPCNWKPSPCGLRTPVTIGSLRRLAWCAAVDQRLVAVQCLVGIAKARQLSAALQQAVRAPAELVGD